MTEQQPEGADEIGSVMDVKMEGSITDGVFRIDAGVDSIALVTLHFNSAGGDILDQLLAVVTESWLNVHESIIEAYEQGVGVENGKHRLVEPDAAEQPEPAEPEVVVPTTAGEGISS